MDAWMDSHRLQFIGTWWTLALIVAGLLRNRFWPRMSLADQVKHLNENRANRKGQDPEAGYQDPEMALSVEDPDTVPDWMQ